MSGFVWSIKLGVEQGQKVIDSWEKKGTLNEVQSVTPTGQSCAPVCISECVPGPAHCYGILGRGSPSPRGLESAPTVSSI